MKSKGLLNMISSLLSNDNSKNYQNATNEALRGMEHLETKINSPIIKNGNFAQGKGNLFEYIEAAKFNVDSAIKRKNYTAEVTDITDMHAAADILIKDGKDIKREVQAKFVQSYNNGKENSAAKSVHYQAGIQKGHFGKYHGMQRLIRKEENYNQNGSLLKESKKLAKRVGDSGDIFAEEYKDVYKNLTDELNYDGVTSKGTTIQEIEKAYNNPEKYINDFNKKVMRKEIKNTSLNMAKSGAFMSGIVSSISNMFALYEDKKELNDAIKDVTKDTLGGAIRGGTTGAISTMIRQKGVQIGNNLLSDSTNTTIIAGSIVDGGVALYSYAKGEISLKEMQQQLIDTTIKSTTTIYYTKAVTAIMGQSLNAIFPVAVYTSANYIVACTREIIKNAKLEEAEYNRMRYVLEDSIETTKKYHDEFKTMIENCEESQRIMYLNFINSFNYNLDTGEGYNDSINAIMHFAQSAGIQLKLTDFNDFKNAMLSNENLKLGN